MSLKRQSQTVVVITICLVLTVLGTQNLSAAVDSQKQHQVVKLLQEPGTVQLRRLKQQPWGSRKAISKLTALAAQRGVDPSQPQVIRAGAGTALSLNPVGLSFALNGQFGGVTKNLFDFRTASDTRAANASADYRSTAIAAPGPGRLTVRSGGDALVFAQRNTTAVNVTRAGSPPPTPIRQRGIEVLFSAATDYSNVGDPGAVTLRDRVDLTPGFPRRRPNRRDIYGSDYDYGTVSLPDSADSHTSIRAALDDEQGRAAAAGRTGTTATALALIARSHATSTSLKGIMSAEDRTGDIFQNIVTSNIVVTPPVPLEQSGADAAVQAVGKSYKLSLRPSVAHTQAAAASRIDAKQSGGKGTGAESSTLSYVAGLKEVRSKSTNAALSGCVGTEFDRLC